MPKKTKREPLLILIDGNNWANRAYYGIPKLSTSTGFETNAIKGFFNMLYSEIKLNKREGSELHLIVCFDVKTEETFRYKLQEEWVKKNPERAKACKLVVDGLSHSYKGRRNKHKDPKKAAASKAARESIAKQIPVIQKLLKALNIPVISGAPWEADDYIGSLAQTKGCVVEIKSRDKDFAQLVTDKVSLVMPEQNNSPEIFIGDDDDCIEHFGIRADQIVDYLMLQGDTVDNIIGVDGIGAKTAVKLLNEYGSIKEMKKVRKEFKGNSRYAKLFRGEEKGLPPFSLTKKLATIKTDIKGLPKLEEMVIGKPNKKRFRKICKELEMKELFGIKIK